MAIRSERLFAGSPEANAGGKGDHEPENNHIQAHLLALHRIAKPMNKVPAAVRIVRMLVSVNMTMPAPIEATVTQNVAAYSASLRLRSSIKGESLAGIGMSTFAHKKAPARTGAH